MTAPGNRAVRGLRHSITALTVMMASALPAFCQATPPPQTASADILRRIAALEAQLAELKALVEQQPVDQPSSVSADRAAPHDDLHNLTYGLALDTYYGFNFNRPIGRVNLLRAYDITSNNFSLNQANVVVESTPDVEAGRRFGGRLDFQFGQATETLQGSLANEPRPWVYRNVFQAYGTYVLPVGRGLTVDFGKWASSLGAENNYTKDQLNYSRSFWFNFLPFYHAGARVTYKVNDALALNYWVTNGTQQTETFNNFKDQFIGAVLQPTKTLTWTAQYYFGQEHPDVEQIQAPGPPTIATQPGLSTTPVTPYFNGKLHIFDTYATWAANDRTTLGLEADYVVSRSPAPLRDARVYGGAGYARYQLSNRSAIAGRTEYLRDAGGLFSGTTQSLREATMTYDYKPQDGFLVRAEWRSDFSNTRFFLTNAVDSRSSHQDTATLGVIWWWGTKKQTW